jgi:microcystin degradation protein MlrC
MKSISWWYERFACLLFSLLLIVVAMLPAVAEGQEGVRTIAIAEILQETNSFSPVATTRRDFEAGCLLFGEGIIPFAREADVELGGFLKVVDELGDGKFRVVPIIKARAMSGGPLERVLYEDLKRRLLDGLKSMDQLDGIYLSLHGAMGVEGLRDPEGDLLKSVRELVGSNIPIGVSHDLHANVTRERVQHATFIVGYKTNLHRDHSEIGYRVGEILIGTLQGRYRPVMAFNKMKLLKGGGMTVDLLSPMRSIFSRMEDMVDDSEQVLDASNFMVHIWLDDPELGWSTVVVTNDKPDLAQRLADELADLDWSVRQVQPPQGHAPSEAIARVKEAWLRRYLGTAVFCDVSDAVGAGAPGESTWILKALLEEAPELTTYITIRDQVAAETAYRKAHPQIRLPMGENCYYPASGHTPDHYRTGRFPGQPRLLW